MSLAIDNKNSKRIAKSGETLYYVHTPNLSQEKDARYTRFEMEVSPQIPIDEIPENYIEWNFNGTNLNHYELSLSKNVTYDKNIEVSARTGNPTADQYKKVKVQWVENYNIQADVVSPAIQKALKELSQYVNEVGTILKRLDKSGELEFNISFQGNEELEENANSRFYNIVRKGGFSGSIDFKFKGFKHGIDLKLAKIEVYLKPIFSLSTNGKMIYKKRNDKTNFEQKDFSMDFGLQADLQAGGEIGVDIGILNINANPYSGISSWGEIKYIYNEKKIKGEIGIGKPYVGIKGEIKLGDYNILPSGEFKHIWENIKYEKQFKIISYER